MTVVLSIQEVNSFAYLSELSVINNWVLEN